MPDGPIGRGEFLKRTTLIGAGVATGAFGIYPRAAKAVEGRPNVLFVLTDDQSPDVVMGRVVERMLSTGGRDWTASAYSDIPYCGPARVGLMTGHYPHNHGATTNGGSYARYKAKEYQKKDLLARVKRSGYRVGLFGKFMNGYGDKGDDGRWYHRATDRWSAVLRNVDADTMVVNEDGKLGKRTQTSSAYFGARSEAFIRNSVAAGVPFFVYFAPTDPHTPHTPDPAHEHSHDGERLVTPATEEMDLSDKSNWTKNRGSGSYSGKGYEGQMEELERTSVNILRLLDTLDELGVAEDTIVIITSDNGYMLGQHGGVHGKQMPYDTGVRVPFQVRMPGQNLPESLLVGRLDVTATVLHAAGSSHLNTDGRSFYGLTPETPWRKRLLVEHPHMGWRTMYEGGMYYMRLPTGEEELYDLSADPYQLERIPKGEAADLYEGMRARSLNLAQAAGDRLRALEEA